MNNEHKALFFILTFLTSFFSFPMEVPAHQDASRFIIKTHEVRDELITILKKAHQAEIAVVHADITCLTNQTVVGLLKEIAQKDKNAVSIHIDPEHSENQTFIAECASSYPQIKLKTSRQHGKRVLIAYKNYNEPSWQHIVHEGSYNPNNTQRGRRKNSEMALVTYDDTTYYEQHRESHNEGMLEDADGEHILPTTPRTRKVYDTTLYRLIESLAERIHPEKGGTLYLGTMGYNNTALHTKLLAFCKHGGTVHMIIDYESMNKGSRKLLKQLTEAGADIIVGKTDNQKRMKGNFHRKYFVRLSDNTHADLVILPSENFTNRTIPIFNHASYHPNNHALGAQIIAAHQEAALKGKPYAQFVEHQIVVAPAPLHEPSTKQERKCCKRWYAVLAWFYKKNN